MLWGQTLLHEALLPDNTQHPTTPSTVSFRVAFLSLPLCLVSSATGALLLKHGQATATVWALVLGYALEGCAFLLYPVAMQAFSLRFLMVCWSASSIINAVFGGYVFFHEEPNVYAVVGCVLVIVGVVISTL